MRCNLRKLEGPLVVQLMLKSDSEAGSVLVVDLEFGVERSQAMDVEEVEQQTWFALVLALES